MTIKKPEDKLRRFAATYLTQKDMAQRAPYLFGFFYQLRPFTARLKPEDTPAPTSSLSCVLALLGL